MAQLVKFLLYKYKFGSAASCKRPDMMALNCNPGSGGMEMGASLELTGQLILWNHCATGSSRKSVSRSKVTIN